MATTQALTNEGPKNRKDLDKQAHTRSAPYRWQTWASRQEPRRTVASLSNMASRAEPTLSNFLLFQSME